MISELLGLPARYTVSRLLGRGAEKRVYLAEDTMLDRPVAIAAVEAWPGGEPAAYLLQEARAMARIGDLPHLVPVYDVIESPAAFYVVSRYLPGGDLATRLRAVDKRAFSLRQSVRLATQLCEALDHAHTNGIAHGDIKPGNVFLDERGDAYLGDFGFARMLGGRRNIPCDRLIGTLAYVAPEQVWGEPPSPAGDLYALGGLLYELTTGALPFAVGDPNELLRLKHDAQPAPPARNDPEIPLLLNDLILALLEKQPEHRPASSGEVRAALESIARTALRLHGTEAPRRPSQGWVREHAEERNELPPEPPLVQREREIATLREVLRKAASGESRVVLISGEAGIGKSRLLAVLRGLAESAGCISLLGHGHEDAPLPYRPFVEALLPLASRIGELNTYDATALRRFLHLEPSNDDSRSLEAADRQGLFLAISRALHTFAESRPLVLILDDLQWSDRASTELFEHLARALSQGVTETDPRIVLVGAHRAVEPDELLGRSLARIRGERVCERMEIAPLSEAGTYEVLEGLGLRRPANYLVRAIYEATQGNPLFIREVLELLGRRGAVYDRGGFARTSASPGDLELPSSLLQTVAVRVRALSEPCRRLLTLASFVGNRFELATLVAIAGRSEDILLDLLEEALEHRLLLDEGETYQFAHPLVRQVFYQSPSRARRSRIHLQIARQLEESDASERRRGALEIAHHLVRAGGAADPAQVARYARRAAQQALANFAWSEAATFFEAAISAAEATGTLSAKERAELSLQAAVSHHRACDAGPCLDHYQAAFEAFDAIDDPSGRAQALDGKLSAELQLGVLPYGQMADVAPLERALADLGTSAPGLRARITGTLALAYWGAQQADRAEDLANRALELARAENDERLCAELSTKLALSQLQKLEPAKALATWENGLAHARRANDLVREEACLQRIPLTLLLMGRLGEAERTLREARRMNQTVQNGASLSLTLANLAALAIIKGEFDAAEAYASECIVMMRRSGFGWSGLMILPSLACARALRGESATAKEAIDLLIQPGFVFDDPGFCVESVGRYHKLIDAYAGNSISAVPQAMSFLGSPSHPLGLDFASITLLCLDVEVAWLSGEGTLSPGVHQALALAVRRGMVFSIAWPFMLPRVLGMTAALERRWDEAEAHFEKAIELADGLRIPTEMGRARLEYAWMLSKLEQRRAKWRAGELLKSAVESLRALRMEGFQRRAVDIAERLGIALD